jgi:hypothetical protein
MSCLSWRVVTTAIILLVASGCAQMPQYRDSTEPNAAKLRIKMEEPLVSNLFLGAIDVEKCEQTAVFNWLTGGIDSLYKDRGVEMLDPQPHKEGLLEFRVSSGKSIAALPRLHVAKANAAEVLFAFNPVIQEAFRKKQPGDCPTPAFVPKAGGQYEIVFRVLPGQCETAIYELKQNGASVARTDVTGELGVFVTVGKDGALLCGPN